jgi:surface antigen
MLFNERSTSMKNKIIALALVSSLALTACAQPGQDNPWGMGNKQTAGTVGGAVAGGVIGSKLGGGGGKLWATGAGALLGAFAGSAIGKSLDQADMAYHQQAVEQAETGPLNKTVDWNNAESGHSGSVTPVREGHVEGSNQLCREYKQTITVDGQNQTANGTACQNADGTWTLQN